MTTADSFVGSIITAFMYLLSCQLSNRLSFAAIQTNLLRLHSKTEERGIIPSFALLIREFG